jgi:hypothetical protein
VRTAIGAGPRRLPVIPWLLVLLAALTVIPVGQALVELIVRPVTVGQLVDRRVGLETQLVAFDGLALLVSLEADPPPDASDANLVYHWYTVRDSLQELRLVLVRSVVALDALRTRNVLARVVEDPAAIERTTAGIEVRGGSQPEPDVGRLLLIEERPRNLPVTDLASLADLDESQVDQLVRVRLQFADGIATCVGRGDCNARALADGTGSWDNLARDDEGRSVVVRTRYPPSVAPFVGVGHHAQDRETVGRLLALPIVQGLFGWGHVLQAAHVEHDLGLPIDHLWLGPILFMAFAALLLIGMRLPYPRFRPRARSGLPAPGRRTIGSVACRASGRVTPPSTSPFEIEDLRAELRSDPPRGAELRIEIDGRWRPFLIPRNLGGLGGTELGDLLTVRSHRPALKVDWFGSNVLLVFADTASRDAANSMVRGSD